ncbi:Scr1 family TA system antitoxin-like transcriptional regulator [Nocardia sp. NPDC005998]|uniref:Scr1 family TA system antitoxin-like transcriptional regulator n=1 Tax=Nocardia sp. NPDC005998 TaxID=3156894 RepID=UPI00339F001A
MTISTTPSPARMERQKVLRNGARRFTFLIEAGALYRTVGSAEVMANQMDALIEASQNPRISLGLIELYGALPVSGTRAYPVRPRNGDSRNPQR